MPKKMIDVDMGELERYLKKPRTIEEIQARFKLASRMTAINVITKATYYIHIYESDKIKGRVLYGIME